MSYTERDFGVKHWTCVVVHDALAEFDMISGDVVSKDQNGITIAVENVLGPNENTFFSFSDIYEIIS
jgi:hypothetical protein